MSYLDFLNFCLYNKPDYIVSSESVVSGPWTTKINMLNEKLIVESEHYQSFSIYLFELYHNMLHFQFIGLGSFYS